MKRYLVVLTCLLVACNPLDKLKGKDSTPAAKVPMAGPGNTAAASAPAEACPAELAATSADRRHFTQRSSGYTSRSQYKAMRWAEGHKQAVSSSEHLSAADAITKVIELEAAHAELVPQAFRAAVTAKPRDVGLRLKMARCEQKVAGLERRASYDFMIAILLGAPAAEVVPELKTAIFSTLDQAYPRACNPDACTGGKKCPCRQGESCHAAARACLTAELVAKHQISDGELAMEDVLTRAALGLGEIDPAAINSYPASVQLVWGTSRVHRCGTVLCELQRTKEGLVRWDLRDGGLNERLIGSMSDKRKRECRLKAGADDQAGCERLCPKVTPGHQDPGTKCRQRCRNVCGNDEFEPVEP